MGSFLASAWSRQRRDEPARRRGAATHDPSHLYFQGNFAPIHQTSPLAPCPYSGRLPNDLIGGQYVRNGGNPVSHRDPGQKAHWFDGDGMLCGVAFFMLPDGRIEPHFANQYVLTDVHQFSVATPLLRRPVMPSIATLIDPLSRLVAIVAIVLRSICLILLSHLPGSSQAIRKISVANTSILYHDGRALATCESGPPMRVLLPSLKTIGWYNGHRAEGEPDDGNSSSSSSSSSFSSSAIPFGGAGPLAFLREWTTAHPRRDPRTGDMLLYHSTFVPPYIRYSIIPEGEGWEEEEEEEEKASEPARRSRRLVNVPVPGITSPKMMHDFGVSSKHTIILDLPLSLAPQNLARNVPVVSYDTSSPSRFGVFPRHDPSRVRWFETAPCCIFHVANAWDSADAVHLLACRLTSPSLVFAAGGLPVDPDDNDECRLYYYQFPLNSSSSRIVHEWALLSLPFEFPSVNGSLSMSAARYVYGCSSASHFSAALGRAVKIDSLVRVDVLRLIARGIANPPTPVTGSVDSRSKDEILASTDPDDAVHIFQLPEGWFAQEPRFVPRKDGKDEEDGWLLTYVFDERQLTESGFAGADAKSELWVIDATRMREGMKAVVARVALPQRVPYGFHGSWFTKEEIENQRPWETVRSSLLPMAGKKEGQHRGWWPKIRNALLAYLG